MKLVKAIIYAYDANNEDSLSELEYCFDRLDSTVRLFNVKEVEIGEFYDDIKINYNNCTQEDYESFFSIDNELISNMVYDFKQLWETMEYTEFDYDEIKRKVIEKHRKLNEIEYKHFVGQLA